MITIDNSNNQTGTKAYTLIGNAACTGSTPTPTPTATPTPTPPAGGSACTLNPAGPNCVWDGTAPGGSSPEGEDTCVEGVNCQTFLLTLSGTPADWIGKKARITISANDANNDYDVYIHKGPSNTGPIVGSGGAPGTPPEVVELDPNNSSIGTGVFAVRVVYWLTPTGVTDQYHAVAEAVGAPTPTPTPSVTPTATPTPGNAGQPRFFNHYTGQGVADDAGEPTLGVNWNTENVNRDASVVAPPGGRTTGQTFKNYTRASDGTLTENQTFNGGTTNYYGGFLAYMLRYNFDDCESPANTLIDQMPITLPAAPRVYGDPILFVDRITGRTFVSQLLGLTPGGSTMEYTDNDGETFLPSEGGAPSQIDHQTIGGGPFRPIGPITPTGPYPHAVYYASQSVATATSQLSVDGGITFPAQTPMFTIADCAGLHGHLKTGDNGIAYVPDKACAAAGVPFVFGGEASVVVSEDNGITWDVRPATGARSDAGVDDPSVGVSMCPDPTDCPDKDARSNTIYLGFLYSDDPATPGVIERARPGIIKSTDGGMTWSAPVDIGAISGVKHAAFPAVVAGDPDRAAFAFFGTTTEASNFDQAEFAGVWYLYLATTFDGGATWDVQNLTPNDPIQRGGICGDGTCRNLLDFFDAEIDKRGRVLLAGEDGCIGGCVNGGPNSFTAKAFVTRQSGGRRMFAAFDGETDTPGNPTVPGAPAVSGQLDAGNTKVTLDWPVPDNGGSPITAYRIYRSYNQGGPYNDASLIATVTSPGFMDITFDPAETDKFYIVTAVNAEGESPFCREFAPVVSLVDPMPWCSLPGVLVTNDVLPNGADNDSGQNTPVDPRVNAKVLHIAEPFVDATTEQFFFTLQVGPSAENSAPPNSQWFIIWNRQMPDSNYDRAYVAMRTDASGNPTFEYGKFGVPIPLDPTNPVIPTGTENTPVREGDADAGSFYNPLTGVIRIVLAKSKLRAFEGAATYQADSDLAGTNVRTYFNRPDPGQRSQNNASDITGDGTYTIKGNVSCAMPPDLVSAFSRKTHGTAGAFDVKLAPLVPATAVGVESRNKGDDSHQVVFVFSSPVSFTGATVTPGSGGTAATPTTSTNGSEVLVNFTASNMQTVTVTLQGVSAGGVAADIAVPMGILQGDVNGTRTVSGADVNAVKAQQSMPVVRDNFLTDVNATGTITGADVNATKSKQSTALP